MSEDRGSAGSGAKTGGEWDAYRAAGASGFGLGSALYRPGMAAADVARRAAMFVQAWRRDGA